MLELQPMNLGLLAGRMNSSRAINTAGAESVIYLKEKREDSLENKITVFQKMVAFQHCNQCSLSFYLGSIY